ncbi:MAG: hypothetical protein IPN53_15740 [Comamonadaceae bacterium]|nr:hypothetical protein [Comamonadaceae bacterium]
MVNFSELLPVFFSTDLPVLPTARAADLALHGAWALVLGAALLGLIMGRLPVAVGRLATVLLMGWAMLSGPMSPSYWLGLAFQSPSLTSALLCLLFLGQSWRQTSAAGDAAHCAGSSLDQRVIGLIPASAGVLLGWVLLLDMLAWWPVSVYAWGFSPAALAALCGLTALFWLAQGASWPGLRTSALMALALGLFATLRLPSGNVWDAVLDPFLWLALHAWLLQPVLRKWVARVA